MAAIKTLCLTSLFLIVSRISALQTGSKSKTACESSDVTVDFIFNIGNDNFANRLWYKNSVIRANRIASVDSTGSLTVESQYSGKIALSGVGGIILYNVTETDSGSYLFVIVTNITSEIGTATTAVNVYVNPNASCMPIIEKDSTDNFTCTISDACPGNDSIQAKWEDGSVGVFTCPSITKNTDYKCCAKGDPVTYCNSGGLCTDIKCKGSGTKCQLELGLALGLGLGIQYVITNIDVGIIIYTSCKYAYILGLGLGLGLGVIFQVGWIIIVSLISKGNECKLELGLGLGLGSGMPYVISFIVSVIFMFFLCKGIPNRVELGKGILTGFLFASVVGIILVYFKYDKLKPEQTSIPKRVEIGKGILTGLLFASVIGIVVVVYLMFHKRKRKLTSTKHEDNPPKQDGTKHEHNPPKSDGKKHEQVPLQPADKKSKTKNPGPPAVHTGTQHKVEPDSNQTNDRQQPPRPQPPPPHNGETPRPKKLPPLTAKQETIQEVIASEESKKKRKKKKKKDQVNEKTLKEENGETDLWVN